MRKERKWGAAPNNGMRAKRPSSREPRNLPKAQPRRARRASGENEWLLAAAFGAVLALMLVAEQVRIAVLGW